MSFKVGDWVIPKKERWENCSDQVWSATNDSVRIKFKAYRISAINGGGGFDLYEFPTQTNMWSNSYWELAKEYNIKELLKKIDG